MLGALPLLLIKDYLVIEQISLMALKENLCCYISRKYIVADIIIKPIEYCSISELRTREKLWTRELIMLI